MRRVLEATTPRSRLLGRALEPSFDFEKAFKMRGMLFGVSGLLLLLLFKMQITNILLLRPTAASLTKFNHLTHHPPLHPSRVCDYLPACPAHILCMPTTRPAPAPL